jgi:hypothetical protein
MIRRRKVWSNGACQATKEMLTGYSNEAKVTAAALKKATRAERVLVTWP